MSLNKKYGTPLQKKNLEMSAKPYLFMVGGAKGVGKTTATSQVALMCDIARVETGQILRKYLEQCPNMNFKEYIVESLCAYSESILVDTHFAEYDPRTTISVPFQRGLESSNLVKLSAAFDINLCLLEINPLELEIRRKLDTKNRVTLLEIISEELEYNRKAAELYSNELKKPIFFLENKNIVNTVQSLSSWILSGGSKC